MEDKKKHCHCGCHEEHTESHCECGDANCQCGDKSNEYLEMAQRIKAEFENYKKRNAEITITSFNNGVVAAVTKLLPALDSFKQAKANITDKQTIEGLDLILSQILTALKDMGVEKIECVNQPFDPNFHNAILTGEDAEKEDGVILEEYQEGFKFKDRVIRHSVVKINKLN